MPCAGPCRRTGPWRWARRSPCRRVRRRVARRPRPAPSPSRCGSRGTRRAGAAAPGRRRCTAGSRPARSARRPGRPGCSVRMSRLSTVSRLISLCECSAMVSAAVAPAPGRSRRRSPGAPVEQRQRQRTQPGSDLEDVVGRLTPDAETIRRTVLASWTKFWPNDLRGRKSISFARCRISVRPSSRMVSAPQSSRYTSATHPNLDAPE